MNRYLTIIGGLCLSIFSLAQAQRHLHWTQVYSYNTEQLWTGSTPKLETVIRHDAKGRRVEQGYERNGKFLPLMRWEYDAKGREILELHLDTLGKPMNWTRKEYHDKDRQYMVSAYGVGKEKAVREDFYFYRDGRLASKRCNYNTEHPLELWLYDPFQRMIQHRYCTDTAGKECIETERTRYDPSRQRWIKTEHDFPKNGSETICLDSACLKRESYRSFWNDGQLFHQMHYYYDSAGREIRVTTLDSVNHNRRMMEKKYDAEGNLIEEFDHIYPAQGQTLLRREQWDSAGRLRLIVKSDPFGKPQFEEHFDYDRVGHLVQRWFREIATGRVWERNTWTYDAEGRCITRSDSSQNWTKEEWEYDAYGRLLRKHIHQWDKDFPYPELGFHPWPEGPTFPQPKFTPPEKVWVETILEYAYDAFDSIATVTRVGYAPPRLNPNAMPGFEPAIGSWYWVYHGAGGIMDTLNQTAHGDTMIFTVKTNHKGIRKTGSFGGEPLQIEEFDSLGNRIVLWRHEDYGKPYAPRSLHPFRSPFVTNADSLAARCLLRVCMKTFTTTSSGDTIFRSEHHPSKPVALWEWKIAYVQGRWVREYVASGAVLTRRWNARGQVERETWMFPGNQKTEKIFQYDAAGRQTGFRQFGDGGNFIQGEDDSYPDAQTVLVYRPELQNERKVVYQLQYWK